MIQKGSLTQGNGIEYTISKVSQLPMQKESYQEFL